METIVITGANRGIGLALAKRFLQEGKDVIATCRALDDATELRSLQERGNLSILTHHQRLHMQRKKNQIY